MTTTTTSGRSSLVVAVMVGLILLLTLLTETTTSATTTERRIGSSSSGSLHQAGNGRSRAFSLSASKLPSVDPKLIGERARHINPESTLYDIPATGVYFVWRNDSIAQIGELLTLKVADTANTDT